MSIRAGLLRKTLVSVLLPLMTGMAAAAGGAWDGIYNCTASGGTQSVTAYISVIGTSASSGSAPTVFTVVATSATQPFFGYGIGQASAAAFSGVTDAGRSFLFNSSGNGFGGTAVVAIGGQVVNATVSCSKIF